MKKSAYISVITAAFLWGILGIFVKHLTASGFTSLQITFIRAGGASVLLLIYLLYKDRSLLRIEPSDVKYFVGTGICSFAFFNWCYFMAIQYTSLSVAAILLYTAPAIVSVLSVILFQEAFTQKKQISLLLTFIGCVLVTGYLQGYDQKISFIGLMTGLGAGLGYALYSIFGKIALKKYDSLTVTAYTFILASIGLLPIAQVKEMFMGFADAETIGYAVALSFFGTVLPFLFYTKGLSSLESSKASIIATLEPVVATIVSIFVFAERISITKFMGILLVIAAIIIIREKKDISEVS